ncbi:MAG TPA: magnesium/cobalt transporter CorA [Planctomycetota bacterium]
MLKALHLSPTSPVREIAAREEIDRLVKSGDGTLWIDMEASTDAERELLVTLCGFHRMAVDQCVSASNHPRLTDYGDYVYLVFHGVKSKRPIATEEIDVFLGAKLLVTYHAVPVSAIQEAWKRCLEVGTLMERGPDRVLAEILDDLADEYLAIMESFDEGIDDIEDRLFKHASRPALREIFAMKKEILHLRRVVSPQREVLNRLARGELRVISQGEAILFRDVFDRVYRVSEMLESFRDVLSSAMEVYLTVVSNRTNEIVKVLTVFSIILMSTSLLAGIYGMNVDLPFQKHPWAFWIVVGVMATISGALMWMFRRRRLL